MFTNLPASRAMRTRSARSTMASVVLHGALIAGAVAMTLPQRVDATPEPVKDRIPLYVAMLDRPRQPPLPVEQIVIGGPGARTAPFFGAGGSSVLPPGGIADAVRFVVDTLGRVEPDAVVVLEATHALFADAVRSALGLYRFSPGEIGGRKVRTMMEQPFTFTLK